MKKLFTLFTMLSLCIASTWAQDLDRSGWTILASSACDDGSSGQVGALIDGSTTTYWHSRWGDGHAYGDTDGGCPHAIQIDLGSDQEFNGIRISNRTDALGNGRVAGYKVYVSNTAFTTSASGFRANEVKGDATPVLSGTFTNTAQGAVNMVGSNTKLSGRYVLFVITSSVNQSSTAYACIAEVNLFSIPDGSYIVTSDATLSDIITYDNFIVNSGVTLTVDVEDFDLTRISGAGDVVLDVDASLTGNKATAATGKLTVNAGKTLTIGGGDSETNSVASFTSIDLLGTIKNNNSTTTLNNVTVPARATGIIYSYDMGSAADGFLLAGTTTVNGTLYVCNKLNFQMKVDQLTGNGTWTTYGTSGEAYAEGTSSSEAATINVASATSFTGSATVRNTNATVNVAGNLKASTWTKTNGTLKYTGTNLAGTTLDGAVLAGNLITTSGKVKIMNLAGNNLENGGSYDYAFVGSGTISFHGTCDLTKKADGTGTAFSKLGYGSSASIAIMNGATLTTGGIFNSRTSDNNAPITIETGGKLIVPGTTSTQFNGIVRSTKFTNNGTLELNDGANISAISGSGKVVLGTFPTTTAPTLTDWTGTVEFPAGGSSTTNLSPIINAWGNASSTVKLNNTQGYLNQGETVSPVLNLAGTLEIVNGYSGEGIASPKLRKVTGAGTLHLKWDAQGVYCIEITELSDFTGTLQGHAKTNPYIRIKVGKYTVASAPSVDEKLFNASGDVTLASLYVGETDQTSAYAWAVSTKDGVSGMYVTASAQQKITDAIALAKTYYSQRLMGTGTGKYTVYIGETGYTDFTKFGTAASAMTTLAAWDGKDVRAVINQPTSGYYKLKSKYNEETGYYLQCENVNNNANAKQATTTDEKAIFYIDANAGNTIESYATGKYFGEHTRANFTADTENPVHWTFTSGHNLGTYTLQSDVEEYNNNKLNGQILYGWSNYQDKLYVDRNSSATDNGHTDWILVPVAAEDLPVIVAPGSTDNNKKILGHIQTVDEVKGKIIAGTAFVDLSEATISSDTNIDAIKGAVAEVNPNAIIIAPAGTTPGSATTNVLLKADEGKYKCNNLQLTDDLIPVFEAGTEFVETNVTYNRATSANQWGTICLPYAVRADGDVAYYRLAAKVDGQTLRFERVTEETKAYEPYLIKKAADAGLTISSASDAAEFTLGNNPEPQDLDVHDGFVLKGTMVNTSVVNGTTYTEAYTDKGYQQAVTDPNAYYFEASSKKFRALNGRFNLKAFRAYLTATGTASADDPANARSILGIDISEDGQSTGISFVESEDGKTVEIVYDLNGRRLQEARKGINIINGKKVIK